MNEWEWQLLEDKPSLDRCTAGGVVFGIGDHVRLCPKKGGDIMDMALGGKIASIEGIEQDYEGKVHVAVVISDDPGKDLGLLRQPGHRFFFSVDEIEPVASQRILIACVGNIFLGDDGFGVEVARSLAGRSLPPGVLLKDFGISGIDLTYALLESHDLVLLVDACPRGGDPGTVYLIEPDAVQVSGETRLEAHSMNPMNVLKAVKAMGGPANKILIVGCEPADLGPEEGKIGLSERVTAAVNEAANLIETLLSKVLHGKSLEAIFEEQ